MPRVVHFEIAADDPDRATRFYQDVFGWQSSKWEGPEEYWLVMTGSPSEPGIDGGIGRRSGFMTWRTPPPTKRLSMRRCR